jgi:hypothetical protein
MIRGSHGVYRLGIAPKEEELLLFSENPDALEPAELREQSFAGGYWLDLEHVGHISVPEARRKRTSYNWEIAAVQSHTQERMMDLTEYAYLNRVSNSLWVSGAIAYRVMSVDVNGLSARRQKALEKRNPDLDFKSPLYVVHCYTTKGRGHNFTDFDEDFLLKPWGRLLTWSARSGMVSQEEAERLIADDFLKRQELVRRGDDPDDLGVPLKKTEPHMHSHFSPREQAYAVHLMRNVFTRSVQEFYIAYQSIKGSSVLKTVGMAIGFALVQLTRGIVPAVIKAASVLASPVIKPVLNALKKAENIDFRRNNIASEFSMSDQENSAKSNDLIDPEMAPFIRLLDYHEVDIRPEQGAEVREEIRDDWAAQKLVDSIGGPPGTMFMKRQLEGKNVLYARQPDGIEAYYLIGEKVAYIRYREEFAHPMSSPLASSVKALFDEYGPYVRVFAKEDAAGQMQEVGVIGYETRREQRKAMREEISKAYEPMELQPLDHSNDNLRAAFERSCEIDSQIASESLLKWTLRSVFNIAVRTVGLSSYAKPCPKNEYKDELVKRMEGRRAMLAAPPKSDMHIPRPR